MSDDKNKAEDVLASIDGTRTPVSLQEVGFGLESAQSSAGSDALDPKRFNDEYFALAAVHPVDGGEPIWKTHFQPDVIWRLDDSRVLIKPSPEGQDKSSIAYWERRGQESALSTHTSSRSRNG